MFKVTIEDDDPEAEVLTITGQHGDLGWAICSALKGSQQPRDCEIIAILIRGMFEGEDIFEFFEGYSSIIREWVELAQKLEDGWEVSDEARENRP